VKRATAWARGGKARGKEDSQKTGRRREGKWVRGEKGGREAGGVRLKNRHTKEKRDQKQDSNGEGKEKKDPTPKTSFCRKRWKRRHSKKKRKRRRNERERCYINLCRTRGEKYKLEKGNIGKNEGHKKD